MLDILLEIVITRILVKDTVLRNNRRTDVLDNNILPFVTILTEDIILLE
jgi:hypothetical protein